MPNFITHNNNTFALKPPVHPSVVSASDVHDKRPSAKVVAMTAKSLVSRAKQIRENAKKRREAKQTEINMEMGKILHPVETTAMNGDTEIHELTPNQKIERLQRLLNTHSKFMDKPLIDRIRREMQELHKLSGKTESGTDNIKRLQEESKQNHSSEPDVKFVNSMKGTEPKVIGHDPQTHENILDDDSRTPDGTEIDNNDDSTEKGELPIEAKLAKEVIKTQVN